MFEHKTVGSVAKASQPGSSIARTIGLFLLVIVCIVGVVYAGKFLLIKVQSSLGYLSKNTIDIVSSSFGKSMVQDADGNINVVIIGMGGANHDAGFLADSIIVASWNPQLHAISMISIPRDLYVELGSGWAVGRVNEVFSDAYHRNDKNIDIAAKMLADKVEEITSIKAPYYAVIDFGGFKDFIDAIGGIDVYVPERIYDTTYPNDQNRGYTTFHVERGQTHMDGATALKYARSRHSSSDFARSSRQHQIIESVIKQILNTQNIQNISTITKLYDQYSQMVTTNIGSKEIIGMIKYIFSLQYVFNFGLTSTCGHQGWQMMEPGCFLYPPEREWFGGASVLITDGSTFNHYAFYDYTRNFGNIIAHQQQFLIENAGIQVLNGIDKTYAKKAHKGTDGHATQVAVKLRKYGFRIVDSANAPTTQTGTVVTITGTGDYAGTISLLKTFFPIDEVVRGDFQTGTDLVITLGNNYIDTRAKEFNYDI